MYAHIHGTKTRAVHLLYIYGPWQEKLSLYRMFLLVEDKLLLTLKKVNTIADKISFMSANIYLRPDGQ